MQNTSGEVLRVRDWDARFENNRTRELKKLEWVPVSNRMDDDAYLELVADGDGAAHLGCWLAIIGIASRCHPRGTLIRDNGTPHAAESLARISRLPVALLQGAISVLISIGWLEVVSGDEIPQDGAGIPQVGAALSQDGAGISHRRKEGKEGRELSEGSESRFAEYRNAYPEPRRNIGVKQASQSYRERIAGTPGEHERLMEGLERHVNSEQWQRSLDEDGGRFIPSMATFMEKERYQDLPEPAREPEPTYPQWKRPGAA
jgi:hypothetical protein